MELWEQSDDILDTKRVWNNNTDCDEKRERSLCRLVVFFGFDRKIL